MFLSSNMAALTSGARYCLVRVILTISITIVPNKIFSYGLKQTMLETEHILLKNCIKIKSNMRFLFLYHLFYGICVKINIINRSISVYTDKRHGGTADQSHLEVMKYM